ncbi:MAG TPA: PAS domain S-box protein, partial [Anaeromyxobacteraceae bacterium]|nr:PAS domain S-box protein [Anaeromyxobacteraceae bacterium]
DVDPHLRNRRTWVWLAVGLVAVAFVGAAGLVVNWALGREVRRRTEALARSERQYRLLADNARDVIWTLDLATGRYTYVSPSIRQLRGLTVEEALAEPVDQSLTPESLRRVQEAMARIGTPDEEDPHTGVYEQPCRNGATKQVEITTTLVREDGRAVAVLGVSRDVTARVRSEEALERTRRTLLMVTRCGEAILRASTEEALYADVCRVIVETGGYRMCWVGAAEHDTRKSVRPVAWAGHEDGYLRTIDVVWDDVPAGRGPTGTAIRERRVVVRTYDDDDPTLSAWKEEAGRRGYHAAAALPIVFEGEVFGALSMYSRVAAPFGEEESRLLRQLADDLAFGVHALRSRAARIRADVDREAAQRALSSEQDRFRALIEGSSDLTLVIDRRGTIRFASPASRDVLGREPAALTGDLVLDHIHVDDQVQARAAMVAALSAPGATARVDVRVRKADGSWALVESSLRNQLDVPGVEGVVVNNRDITERNRLREQVQQAQKLESVGRLAGGVAHDFNNLLTIILACGEEVRSGLADASPAVRESIDDILAAGRRAAELTRQLLAFARKQVIAPELVDLNQLLRQGKKLLGRVIGEDIRVVERYEPGLWSVRADPGLLTQVLMNLAVNARDAMPGGGTLTLSTHNLDLRPGDAAPDAGMAPGPWVRLTVQDTGIGMSPEVLAHVFEPFFTTKPPGVGTGLGLATVYGIVKQSGAHLTVRSAPGAGTTFDVYFPRVADERRPERAPEAAPSPGSETVLLVEDDRNVREVAVRALRSGGYRVLAAEGADPAIELARVEPGRIHLVVTDVVMPGTGGRDMARRIAELRPGIRVLFVSGYTHDAISRQGVLDEGIEFLPKPFTAAELLGRVRAVLDHA